MQKNQINYYQNIKQLLIDNEIYNKVKDYSKNKNDLETYYNVGKELFKAGKEYGENIVKQFSDNLIQEICKKYNERTLRRYRQFYILFSNQKWSPMATKLTWSHVTELLSVKNIDAINYYIEQSYKNNLSKRQLREKIKSNRFKKRTYRTNTDLYELYR